LEAVEKGNFGFTLMLDKNNQFKGIVSSADIRKALLRKIDMPSEIIPQDLINSNPIKITAKSTVVELLQLIKKCNFPVMYFPIVDDHQNAVGIINFVHLIKGEI
jgi:CBS domain-containing protein